MTEVAIGVDLGGTQLRVALVDREGRLLAQQRGPTDAARGATDVLERMVAQIQHIQTSLAPDATLFGVGIGMPGPLDPEQGITFRLPNLVGWENLPVRDILQDRLHIPVSIGNDANVAALGEWLFGGARGCRHVVYITVSTGIGGGVILDNQLVLGRAGAAAEVGHIVLDATTRQSWEQLASGTGLARAAAQAMRDDAKTSLHTAATPETVTAADVSTAAARGDLCATRLMQREAELLGLGFASMLHLYSPDIIVVGGSVITANPSLLEAARAVAHTQVIADVYKSVPIQLAGLGDAVGVLGAAALVWAPQLAGTIRTA